MFSSQEGMGKKTISLIINYLGSLQVDFFYIYILVIFTCVKSRAVHFRVCACSTMWVKYSHYKDNLHLGQAY